jgi:hypothetical protein
MVLVAQGVVNQAELFDSVKRCRTDLEFWQCVVKSKESLSTGIIRYVEAAEGCRQWSGMQRLGSNKQAVSTILTGPVLPVVSTPAIPW